MQKSIARIYRPIYNFIYNINKTTKKRRVIKQFQHQVNRGSKIRLDLGCGALKRDGFIGIDLSPEADIQWDLRQGIPCKDNSVSVIRSDHFFEHLELIDFIKILRECRRVLITGGVLDFSVPHIDPYIQAYLNRDLDFLKEKIYDIPEGKEDLYNTCFDRIAWLLCREGEHKSVFDKDSIIAKVRFAGFDKVTPREYDPEKDPDQRFSSIYIVAIK